MTFDRPAEAPHSSPDSALQSTAGAQLPAALLDEIEYGLLICDVKGTLHFANRAARNELAAASLLTRQANRLCLTAGSRGDLDGAMRQSTQRGRRVLVRLENACDRLMVSAVPMTLRDGLPGVLVMLGRRKPCSELGLELLAGIYGLTLAERRVLGALMHEMLPRDIAARHAVALSTVRTQIASIRCKLGARNVEAVLLRAAEVPPLASALRLAAGGIGPGPLSIRVAA